jgi:hypothetical protein
LREGADYLRGPIKLSCAKKRSRGKAMRLKRNGGTDGCRDVEMDAP